MAVALLATLYGALVANLVCLPIADKLHVKLTDEDTNRTLIIDGILMIRDSKSPALVREMLLAYLPEKHRHDVVEEAAGFLLAKELAGRGVKVLVFDPAYGKQSPAAIPDHIRFAANAADCIAGSDVVVLATSWPEFNNIPRELWARNSNQGPRTVIDCWRTLKFLQHEPGVRYLGLGLGEGFV